ncbi:glycoside hydrolase family 88 protein [Streptomyces sp. NPDC006012]|uniref:glycoside hydrolase family 88 protein n=1 Tax=Streptomyces sp. NPDC006012 TaxID=3364739 RepID=UPI0036CD8F02
MNRRQLLTGGTALAATATVLSAAPASAAPPPLPRRAEVVAVLRRVADHWIGSHQDPGDNGWANATFFSGLLALHRLSGEPRHLAYAKAWAEKHDYALNGGVATRHADNHNAGQAYLDLYEIGAWPAPPSTRTASSATSRTSATAPSPASPSPTTAPRTSAWARFCWGVRSSPCCAGDAPPGGLRRGRRSTAGVRGLVAQFPAPLSGRGIQRSICAQFAGTRPVGPGTG